MLTIMKQNISGRIISAEKVPDVNTKRRAAQIAHQSNARCCDKNLWIGAWERPLDEMPYRFLYSYEHEKEA